MSMQLFDEEPTNHLNDEQFERMVNALHKLPQFTMECSRPPMPAKDFEACYRVQFGCGERIGETLSHIPEDFDLYRKMITIRQSKTGYKKSKMRSDGTFVKEFVAQKTTITPRDSVWLRAYLETKQHGKRIWQVTRSTIWRYGKDACVYAGLNICEEQDGRFIKGFWTHCLRKSCSKRMLKFGASRELRMLKLRHANKDAHDTYDKQDTNTLLKWEAEHLA